MLKRVLVVAKDFNAAKHWANAQRLSSGGWVYVACYFNVLGNAGCEYVLIDGWDSRPDTRRILEELEAQGCVQREETRGG